MEIKRLVNKKVVNRSIKGMVLRQDKYMKAYYLVQPGENMVIRTKSVFGNTLFDNRPLWY